MRIHKDSNGVAVNAISALAGGENVEGHYYQILAGEGSVDLQFQNGGVQQNGVNGITNEALLAILIHRTQFLNDKFPCGENERAILSMQNALDNLEARTARRIQRGVEGQEIE